MTGITDERKTYLKQEAIKRIDHAIALIQDELLNKTEGVPVQKISLEKWLLNLRVMKAGVSDPSQAPWSQLWINGIGRGLDEMGFPNKSKISDAISGAAYYYDRVRRFVY